MSTGIGLIWTSWFTVDVTWSSKSWKLVSSWRCSWIRICNFQSGRWFVRSAILLIVQCRFSITSTDEPVSGPNNKIVFGVCMTPCDFGTFHELLWRRGTRTTETSETDTSSSESSSSLSFSPAPSGVSSSDTSRVRVLQEFERYVVATRSWCDRCSVYIEINT